MTDPRYMQEGIDFAVGLLIEELGELQAALGKTLRWGADSVNPELPVEEQEPNWQWIEREINDVLGAIANYRKEAGTPRTPHLEARAFNGVWADVPPSHPGLAKSSFGSAMREALEEAAIWHDQQDKAISKAPNANIGENCWRRLQHQEQAAALRAALQENIA